MIQLLILSNSNICLEIFNYTYSVIIILLEEKNIKYEQFQPVNNIKLWVVSTSKYTLSKCFKFIFTVEKDGIKGVCWKSQHPTLQI